MTPCASPTRRRTGCRGPSRPATSSGARPSPAASAPAPSASTAASGTAPMPRSAATRARASAASAASKAWRSSPRPRPSAGRPASQLETEQAALDDGGGGVDVVGGVPAGHGRVEQDQKKEGVGVDVAEAAGGEEAGHTDAPEVEGGGRLVTELVILGRG